jgi:hypothetical protein
MEKVVSAEKIDEFLRLARAFRDFCNYDQHREQDPKKPKKPKHPPVLTVRREQFRPVIATLEYGYMISIRSRLANCLNL